MHQRRTGSRFKSVRQLQDGWEFCSTDPGACANPSDVEATVTEWCSTTAPSTVASSLRALDQWSLDGEPRRFDALDWWYRLTFVVTPASAPSVLAFDGLATAATVWLDGVPILQSNNMFIRHELPVPVADGGAHTLHLRFSSLDRLLTQRRPRPRWRAPMVENQQLRWWRTTLLGRTPGWSPPAAVVGPWRPVWLGELADNGIYDIDLEAQVRDADGLLTLKARVAGQVADHLVLELRRSGTTYRTRLECADGATVTGELIVPDVERWWPHTHGDPALYDAFVCDDERELLSLGRVGFRTVAVDIKGDAFGVSVNGVPVFCRGACWTPLDPVSLSSAPADYERTLGLVRQGGMNMVRLAGTMTYEGDTFFDLCDSLGILVWQDLMFANMDYPAADVSFVESACAEVAQVLGDLRRRPSLAVICGNSEVEQQAAMWGAPRTLWQPEFFHRTLADLARSLAPAVPYWPSSAHGGVFPHDPSAGTCSYYGVGAYQLPLQDARMAPPRFATECLALANIPEADSLKRLNADSAIRMHELLWRKRAPRDRGAGWDFDDVRDYYVEAMYGVKASAVRYSDHDRYLFLGRLASADLMRTVMAQWRGGKSRCDGALVLFLQDLWPGAGWGVLDSDGAPKSAWYGLRHALQPIGLHVLDEGCSGLSIEITNDSPHTVKGQLTLIRLRDNRPVGETGTIEVAVGPHASLSRSLLDAFGEWHDLSNAYRFGPPAYDVLLVRLDDSQQHRRVETSFVPRHVPLPPARWADVTVNARWQGGDLELEIASVTYVRGFAIEAEGYSCSDNYFDIWPNQSPRLIRLVAGTSDAPSTVVCRALNINRQFPLSPPSQK